MIYAVYRTTSLQPARNGVPGTKKTDASAQGVTPGIPSRVSAPCS